MCCLCRSVVMEISWRISMSKHTGEMIHGHSALKKSTSILHIFPLHCHLHRGRYHNMLLYSCFYSWTTMTCVRCMCFVSVLFHKNMNDNMSEQDVNTSLRQISLPAPRLEMCTDVNESQEAGRLDNYRDPHQIQMSIKLFRAWHNTPPLTRREDDWKKGKNKREKKK